MKHVVVGLARYLMGAYLGLGRVRDLRDIASGLALCSIFIQVSMPFGTVKVADFP